VALVGLAALAAAAGLARMFWPSDVPVQQRIDQTALLYLAVAGGLLLLRQIKAFSLGEFKVEMLEKLREGQARQEEKIDYLALMLPLLLPEKELKLLKKLGGGAPALAHGGHDLRGQLRRLRSMALAVNCPDREVRQIKDGVEVDMKDYVKLTDLGKRWVKQIREMEEAEEGGGE
jgi:hypothetical protein